MKQEKQLRKRIIVILMISSTLFWLAGAVVFHELSHYFDLRKYAADGRTCLFINCGKDTAGSYIFYPTNLVKVNQIEKYTEYKAYGIDIIFSAIMIASLILMGKRLLEED